MSTQTFTPLGRSPERGAHTQVRRSSGFPGTPGTFKFQESLKLLSFEEELGVFRGETSGRPEAAAEP